MDSLTDLNNYSDEIISFTDVNLSTVNQSRYRINGFLDTSNTILKNLEELASSATSFVSFDNTTGKWSISINRAGTSVFSFDDTNIIGGIEITETSFTDLYNSVEVQFPHKDLSNQKDWTRIDFPIADRFPNEPLNSLAISTKTINDPIQADLIGLTELKQSRVNKIVEFQTDFSTIGLQAGNLIDITSEIYGWTNKVFRIITIREEDDDSGNVILSYSCLEYDPDVYDYSNLEKFDRSRATGIPPKLINPQIAESEDAATSVDLTRLLGFAALSELLNILIAIFLRPEDVDPDFVKEPGPANVNECGTSPVFLGETAIVQKPSKEATDLLVCGTNAGEFTEIVDTEFKNGQNYTITENFVSIIAKMFVNI